MARYHDVTWRHGITSWCHMTSLHYVIWRHYMTSHNATEPLVCLCVCFCLSALSRLNGLMYGHKLWHRNWPWWLKKFKVSKGPGLGGWVNTRTREVQQHFSVFFRYLSDIDTTCVETLITSKRSEIWIFGWNWYKRSLGAGELDCSELARTTTWYTDHMSLPPASVLEVIETVLSVCVCVCVC